MMCVEVQGMQCRTLRVSNVDVATVSTGGACSVSGKVMSSKMPNKPCSFILHLAKFIKPLHSGEHQLYHLFSEILEPSSL